jgi:hypothetical protein
VLHSVQPAVLDVKQSAASALCTVLLYDLDQHSVAVELSLTLIMRSAVCMSVAEFMVGYRGVVTAFQARCQHHDVAVRPS